MRCCLFGHRSDVCSRKVVKVENYSATVEHVCKRCGTRYQKTKKYDYEDHDWMQEHVLADRARNAKNFDTVILQRDTFECQRDKLETRLEFEKQRNTRLCERWDQQRERSRTQRSGLFESNKNLWRKVEEARQLNIKLSAELEAIKAYDAKARKRKG